jgi:hypothetical protein
MQLVTERAPGDPPVTARQRRVFADHGPTRGRLDLLILSTAGKDILDDIGGELIWMFIAYQITLVASMPLWGKLGDVLGRKRTFQTAIVLFVAASVFAGLATGPVILIIGRALQGVAGGGISGQAQAIIGDIVPPRERGRYAWLTPTVYATAAMLGPFIGGFFVDHLTWRWIFFINALGALAFVHRRGFKVPVGGCTPLDSWAQCWSARSRCSLADGGERDGRRSSSSRPSPGYLRGIAVSRSAGSPSRCSLQLQDRIVAGHRGRSAWCANWPGRVPPHLPADRHRRERDRGRLACCRCLWARARIRHVQAPIAHGRYRWYPCGHQHHRRPVPAEHGKRTSPSRRCGPTRSSSVWLGHRSPVLMSPCRTPCRTRTGVVVAQQFDARSARCSGRRSAIWPLAQQH